MQVTLYCSLMLTVIFGMHRKLLFELNDSDSSDFVDETEANDTAAGCGNKYMKPPTVPYDLCVQHREWRSFTNFGQS